MKKKVYCLNLYSSCNNKCKMCSVSHLLSGSSGKSLKDVKGEILKVARMGYNVIDFGGSEPTLYPGLIEAIRYSKKLGLRPAIFTNGHRLASFSYIKKLIPLKPIGIKTSFHSHKEGVFDRITGNPGSYQKTLKAIENVHKYLSTSPSRIGGLLVNIVVNRYNYNDLPEIVRFLRDRNVKHIKLTQLLLLGSVYKNPDLLIDLNKVYPFFLKAVTFMKKAGMDYDFDNFPTCFMESEHRRFNPKYGNIRGLKLVRCKQCRYDKRCTGIPKLQIIVRYKRRLLKANGLFPDGSVGSVFNPEEIAFIKNMESVC